MNVGFSVFWRFDLNHEFNVWNVETSGGHVGGDKHLELAFSEPLQGDFSLILSNVSVHHFKVTLNLVRHQQRVSISLGLSENESLAILAITD